MHMCAQIHTDVHAGLSRYSAMKRCSMHVCTHTLMYAPVAQPRSQQEKVSTLQQGENSFKKGPLTKVRAGRRDTEKQEWCTWGLAVLGSQGAPSAWRGRGGSDRGQ